MTSITTIVPTIGRPSLVNTLDGLFKQARTEDCVWVVYDGVDHVGMSRNEVDHLLAKYRRYSDADWILSTTDLGNWGHGSRNHVLDLGISTDYVWTIDDDDQVAPDAFVWFRVQEADWAIYKMHFGPGHPAKGITCWREQLLRFGDIGTPMVLAKPGKARFGLRYEGDWDYAQALQEEYGEPVWEPHIVAHIRPIGEDE
jgi:hypothetical protein